MPRRAAGINKSIRVGRALELEYFTIGWSVIETLVAIASGVRASSVALTAFGIDSGIELGTAAIIAVRLRSLITTGDANEVKERRALRAVAVGFYALALCVLVDASLSIAFQVHPDSSPFGIYITLAALVVMPALAFAKRRVAVGISNEHPVAAALMRTDAAETILCAVLSATTLLGLVLNAGLGWWWADPVASLVIIFFAIREGREAWMGELVCADDD